jgi:hypothetical protein
MHCSCVSSAPRCIPMEFQCCLALASIQRFAWVRKKPEILKREASAGALRVRSAHYHHPSSVTCHVRNSSDDRVSAACVKRQRATNDNDGGESEGRSAEHRMQQHGNSSATTVLFADAPYDGWTLASETVRVLCIPSFVDPKHKHLLYTNPKNVIKPPCFSESRYR